MNSHIAQPQVANTAPTFSRPDGKLTTDFGGHDSASSIALGAWGIVVAGTSQINTGSNGSFVLVRYLNDGISDGTLDTRLDGDGKLTTPIGNGESLVIQPGDQRMVVAGSDGTHFIVARYHPDGRLDTSFDGDGKVSTNFAGFGTSTGYGRSVVLQADGKIIVAGEMESSAQDSSFITEYNNFALARYEKDGRLDTGFGTNGEVATNFETAVSHSTGIRSEVDVGYNVALQTDSKIVVAGISNGNFALARYSSSGALDTTFDIDGKVTTDFGGEDIAHSVITQMDGTLLVAGSSDGRFALARYKSDGSLDTGFDGDGKVTTAFGSDVHGYTMALQTDGKIIVVGTSDSQFALARYNTDGSLDTTFDSDGKVTTVFDGVASARSVTVQSDGKILVAGTVTNALGQSDFSLARYTSDGSLDSNFSPSENTLDNRPTYAEPSTTEASVPVVLDRTVHVFDAELTKLNYAGATLVLSRQGGANVDDVFSAVADSGLSPLKVGLALSVDGTSIGSVVGNTLGKLEIKFNLGASQTLLDKALSNIAYSNTSDAPPASVTIDWVFSDGNTTTQGTGGALGVTGQTVVGITARNDSPVLNTKAPLINQTLSADVPFSYTFASDAFIDPDLDSLAYSAITTQETALPLWLNFDPLTRTLSGTPSASDVGTWGVRITAKDSAAASVFGTVQVVVRSTPTTVTGTSSTDNFKSTAADELFNAGAGVDRVDFSGSRANYTVNKTDSGWTVYSVAEGFDWLYEVERLKFGDTAFALDVNGNAGQAYRLYQAALNRAPDAGGLSYWIYYLDQGHTLTEVGTQFMQSDEFKGLYGQNPTNTAFVTQLYQNVLHRQPEKSGLNFWVAELDSGRQTASQVLAGFSESTENQANLVGTIGNGFAYTPYGA